MASTNPKINLSGLARRLVQDELLDETTAEKAVAEARRKKIQFVSHLVENKLVGSQEIAWAASQEFGVPLFDISTIMPCPC